MMNYEQRQQQKQKERQARQVAEALHEVSRTRWIAVSEGLPPVGLSVYVVVKKFARSPGQAVAYVWDSDTKPKWSVFYRPEDITHWRAMHELPK